MKPFHVYLAATIMLSLVMYKNPLIVSWLGCEIRIGGGGLKQYQHGTFFLFKVVRSE